MATSTQTPNDLTRQQLDELDDLLQRMLSLPLNPPDSFSPPPPAQTYSPPMPAPASVPMAREAPMPISTPRSFTPAPVEAPVWKPAPAPMPVSVPVSAPRAEPVPVPTPAPVSTASAPFEWPVSTPAKPAPAAHVYVLPEPEPVPFLYAPFVAFNAVLNWTLGLFGFPGRFLRSGFVKNLLGLGGMGLLIYTGLKVAQIHGLVSLPQELPWPR